MDNDKTLKGEPPKRIDFTTGQFESCGRKYYIQPLELHFPRLKLFNTDKPDIIHAVKHEESLRFIFDLRNDIMRPDPSKGLVQIHAELTLKVNEFCKGVEGRDPSKVSEINYQKYLKFCTYFITVEGEDLTKWDAVLAQKKIDDWLQDMYIEDFFFAVLQRLKQSTGASNDFIKAIQEMTV